MVHHGLLVYDGKQVYDVGESGVFAFLETLNCPVYAVWTSLKTSIAVLPITLAGVNILIANFAILTFLLRMSEPQLM